ncbi:MAG: dihydrofolate reductase family protein [Bryobacteraceae bacterium]|nr:dihydrofolate reductase family protein [Bryobacteraceae bacterium]
MARKLVYYVACTLDGFIARKNGSFDCFLFQGEHFPDLIARFPETFPAHLRGVLGASETARRFDTVLMGRNTYQVGLDAGVTNPYKPLRQIVVSNSLMESPDPAVELHRGSSLVLVQGLKRENGLDIWLCGGSKLAGSFLGEIDEFVLKINPVLIGTGIPLFDRAAGALPTTLIEHKAYANGFVLARYAPVR